VEVLDAVDRAAAAVMTRAATAPYQDILRIDVTSVRPNRRV
jgi:hypothetical protein